MWPGKILYYIKSGAHYPERATPIQPNRGKKKHFEKIFTVTNNDNNYNITNNNNNNNKTNDFYANVISNNSLSGNLIIQQ